MLTNSDPTSGNALEQVPKLLIALSAGTLLAEEAERRVGARGSRPPLAIAAALGAIAARSFARRLPRYPQPGPGGSPHGEALARSAST